MTCTKTCTKMCKKTCTKMCKKMCTKKCKKKCIKKCIKEPDVGKGGHSNFTTERQDAVIAGESESCILKSSEQSAGTSAPEEKKDEACVFGC